MGLGTLEANNKPENDVYKWIHKYRKENDLMEKKNINLWFFF